MHKKNFLLENVTINLLTKLKYINTYFKIHLDLIYFRYIN
jgi:hypothetical protein